MARSCIRWLAGGAAVLVAVAAARGEMTQVAYPPSPDILQKLIAGAQRSGDPLASKTVTEGSLKYCYHLRTAIYVGSWGNEESSDSNAGENNPGTTDPSAPTDPTTPGIGSGTTTPGSGTTTPATPSTGDAQKAAQAALEAMHLAQFLFVKSAPEGQEGLIPATATAYLVFFDQNYKPVTYWRMDALGPFTMEEGVLKYGDDEVFDINQIPLVGNILVNGIPQPIPKL